MKRLPAFVVLSALLGFITHTGLALAQGPDRAAMMASAAKSAFQKLKAEVDKDKDGKLSRAEFFAAWKDKEKAEKNYKAWDLNQDGYITEEEYVKAVANIAKPRNR
jgi:Ca2+-binding EF-hand superfamily protein